MSSISVAFFVLALCAAALAGPAVPVVPVLPIQNFQPRPYQYGYAFADGLGMSQHKNEVADGTGAVKGAYGYQDPLGVYRNVEYTADKDGYKAVIRSNEPGTSNHAAADAVYIVELPPAAAIAQGLRAAVPVAKLTV
ncbi:cuticle protein 10.9-like [Argiope bruennichi]|uniref:Cuticle protein 10.9 like protein n=1 Tax=Argiope bruennichi TaxID=94029 RepID=A0A8T0EEK9_ARGBR|nr:cuticle protein 10.9-like [Argiope bruennichi]KAF8771157.1 Cuticle protein 10.9 like protein [Argiope bruennichi]